MPVNVGNVFIDTKGLDELANADVAADKIVMQYGYVIAGEAATQAPVDTGALKNSIVSESGPTDLMQFRIQDGVEYGIYQELGTSKIAAQPFLVPALEKYKDKFLQAFEALFK